MDHLVTIFGLSGLFALVLLAGAIYARRLRQRSRSRLSLHTDAGHDQIDAHAQTVKSVSIAQANAPAYFGIPEEVPANTTDRFDLPQLVREVCRSYETMAAEKRIRLIASIQDGAPHHVHAIARNVHQILASLVNVTLALTGSGGTIEVVLHRLSGDAPDNLIRLSILDSGPALSSEAIDALFHPFGLDDFSSSRIPASLGLHPYMARQFAARHGGRVDYAKQGQGGCFTIEFLTDTWNSAAAKNEPDYAQVLRDCFVQHRAQVSPQRILVIEDQVTSQHILTTTLESVGHQVTLAATGHAALSHLDEEDFDVVLLDLGLPDMGGIEVLKLKRFSANAYAPCIVISGDITPESRRMAQGLGIAMFLTKPVRVQALLETLARTLHPEACARPEDEEGKSAQG